MKPSNLFKLRCFHTPGSLNNDLLMSLFVVFGASLCMMLLYLHLHVDSFSRGPLEESFMEPQVQYVIYGIIFQIAVTATIAWEIILDLFLCFEFAPIQDKTERLFMLFVVVIPGFFMLAYSHSPNAPFIFCFLHSVQAIGSMAPIFSLCMKHVPAHFHPQKVFVAYLFWAASVTCMFFGFNRPLQNWPCVLGSISVFIFLSIIFEMIVRCGIDVCRRTPQNSSRRCRKGKWKYLIELMRDDEICCFLYLSCALLTIVFVFVITGAVRLYRWELWGLKDLLLNIYSVAAFSVFPSAIPGRLRQKNAWMQIQDKIQANHTTVRYISHELRSPLSIVKTGIVFVLEQIAGKASAIVLEMLTDIQDACGAATCIADELLNLGEIEAGTFKIVKEFKPVSILTRMVKRCHVLALQKNVQMTVENHVQRSKTNEAFGVSVDCLKIEQVFMNLITNSIKFTPPQGSIHVDLKFEPLDSLSDIEHQTPTRTKSFQLGKRRYLSRRNAKFQVHPVGISRSPSRSFVINMDKSRIYRTKSKLKVEKNPVGSICIAITDTGVGMTETQCKHLLGEIDHFHPDTLEGRGGSGLGLWICKQIINRHGGSITFNSRGLNKGTTFSIRLLCYEWDEQIVPLSPKASVATDHNNLLSNLFSSLKYDMNCQPPDLKSISCCSSAGKHNELEMKPESRLVASKDIQVFRTQSRTSRKFFSFVDENEECDLDNNEIQKTFNTHILIVDDSAMNRKVVKRSVERAVETLQCKNRCTIKAEIVEADDGAPAVQLVLADQEKFSLIFMDNIMTKMNGPQAAEKIRNEGYSGQIIGVTGNVSESDIADFIAHGADAVLEKPVSLEKMSSVIESFCFECTKKTKNISL